MPRGCGDPWSGGSTGSKASNGPTARLPAASMTSRATTSRCSRSACADELEAATRCRTYLRTHLQGPDGELSFGAEKTGIARMARNLANYMDGWVAIGAWLLEDFELADAVARLLTRAQSAQHGGVLTGPERWAGRPRYDLATAASCGRAFLFCGLRDEALAAGGFLAAALDRQTTPHDGLDVVFDASWNILPPPDRSERSYYRFDLRRRGEKVWFPAFACAFLCELHAVSRDPSHLASAKAYYAFVEATPEFKDGTLANGKSGWSAGLLASATSEEPYREALRRIAGNVIGRQAKSGEFGASGGHESGHQTAEADEMPRRLERTAEFTTWTAEFLRMSAAGMMDPHAG